MKVGDKVTVKDEAGRICTEYINEEYTYWVRIDTACSAYMLDKKKYYLSNSMRWVEEKDIKLA